MSFVVGKGNVYYIVLAYYAPGHYRYNLGKCGPPARNPIRSTNTVWLGLLGYLDPSLVVSIKSVLISSQLDPERNQATGLKVER